MRDRPAATVPQKLAAAVLTADKKQLVNSALELDVVVGGSLCSWYTTAVVIWSLRFGQGNMTSYCSDTLVSIEGAGHLFEVVTIYFISVENLNFQCPISWLWRYVKTTAIRTGAAAACIKQPVCRCWLQRMLLWWHWRQVPCHSTICFPGDPIV